MRYFLEAGCALLLILMIRFPQEALSGAEDGLVLWFQTMLPSLFPFMILTGVLMGSPAALLLNRYVTPLSKKLFCISGEGCYCILTGFLCGYPLGAKMIATLVQNRRLSHLEGQYLLRFSNNASPGFLLVYVAQTILGNRIPLRFFLTCIYGPALLTALLGQWKLRRKMGYKSSADFSHPTNDTDIPDRTVGDAIIDSFEAMIRLCGYLVLFSVIIKMVTVLLPTVTTLRAVLAGFLEITTGLAALSKLPEAEMTTALILGATAFGGLSCIAQTAGMCRDSGLSIADYTIWKLIQGALAFMAALLFLYL